MSLRGAKQVAILFLLSISLSLIPRSFTEGFKLTFQAIFIPLRNTSRHLEALFSSIFARGPSLGHARQDQLSVELLYLRQKVRELTNEIIDLRHQLWGLGMLRKRLSGHAFTFTIADNVLPSSPTQWHSSMTVACGRREGIKKGMPVVWAGHLIGRISEVGVFTSRVQLVTDKEFKIGVVVVPKYLGEGTQTRGQVGVLEGNASGGCIVKWLYGGTDIRKGWFVITKGDPFIPLPRGLIVGEVENTSYRSNVEISVTPIINFSNLEYVIILKPKDADS